MRVESVGAAALPSTQKTRDPGHVVQDVFTAVLRESGRDGYVSAQAISDDEPLADQIVTSWFDWFDGQRINGRYQDSADAQLFEQSYGEILVQAYDQGGYADPKAFLDSLSEDQLEVVRRVHSLADPISVDELSEEGALNLLLPPPAQVDLNHDGFTRSGIAYGMRFPDSNTPADVTAAWEEATEGMSLRDRMIYELEMMLPLLTANIVCDEDGRFLERYEPGDPRFTNPMASEDYSYSDAVQDCLDYLERFRNQMPPERYQKDTAFWTKLEGLFAERGVA